MTFIPGKKIVLKIIQIKYDFFKNIPIKNDLAFLFIPSLGNVILTFWSTPFHCHMLSSPEIKYVYHEYDFIHIYIIIFFWNKTDCRADHSVYLFVFCTRGKGVEFWGTFRYFFFHKKHKKEALVELQVSFLEKMNIERSNGAGTCGELPRWKWLNFYNNMKYE